MKRNIIAASLIVLALLAFTLWTPDRNRALLQARYLAAPADLMTVAGTTLHVRDNGAKDAPAIVFLHGFGSSLHTWEPWSLALQRDFRVVRFDLPGDGLSPPDPTGDYSDARSIQLLIALMDHLGIARANIVGNSMGGRIAWTFAAQHPERVLRLVLISPDGFPSAGFEIGKAPSVPMSIQLMRFTLPKFVLKMSLQPAYADPAAMTDALVTRYHDLLLAPGARGAMIARMQQTVLVDPVPLLKSIHAPTLLLWGQQDAMIPINNSADYLNALPDARLITLPHLGHLPQEEDPARALVPLRAFLTSSAPPMAPPN